MKKVVVLGGGLVGGVMARDIAVDPQLQVTVVDRDEALLARLRERAKVATERADFADLGRVQALVQAHDLVLGAVPGFLGFRVLQAIIQARRPVVDISFMPENALDLDGLARERGVPAVFDCGVAPGMSNVLVGHAATLLEEVDTALILVGGLPMQRHWPYEYAAVFSPLDVIEEYTRPARYVEHGVLVERPALTDPELVEFPGLGSLEAFNTDGLRSLMYTIKAPNLKEKTLRWPGHIDKMRLLHDTGFFSKEPIEVAGATVRPLDVTARLMFPLWQLQEGQEELTVMRVQVDGRAGGKRVRRTWDLLDRTDRVTGEMSMARTTGFPATAMARLMLAGGFARPGVHAPEVLGQDQAIFDHLMRSLRERRVTFTERVEDLG
ncbi:MAG: saccharopine dehydrogenase NADP-binding domain-containing protein [Deltaproteobacteria bacterium]|nr:saccharopine dehydrogenase NADP-binding domain-containing protein [Deltaproteobacteria bacterium]